MSVAGSKLTINVGYSNPVLMDIPKGLEIADVSKKGDSFSIVGFDKQLVGEFAAQVRKVRPPEPYKGKGIRYKTEHVRTKQGKKVGGKNDKAKSSNTIRNYNTVKNVLLKYAQTLPSNRLDFEDFDMKFYEDFQTWIYAQGC